MPQNDDGTRIEPLVSEPSESGTSPPATAPPEPLDEPRLPPDVQVIGRVGAVSGRSEDDAVAQPDLDRDRQVPVERDIEDRQADRHGSVLVERRQDEPALLPPIRLPSVLGKDRNSLHGPGA